MSTFTKEELIRYNRQIMLPEMGIQGQQKLKSAKVLVVGAGGLGCPVLLYLSGAGIGNIGVIDFDKVELHNLHRQILYSAEDIGRSKAEASVEKLKKQNPNISFTSYNEMLNETNAEKLISVYDLVIDGSDNFMTRYLVNNTCVKLNKPLVYGSILKNEGQIALFNYKGSKNLLDLYPTPPNEEDVPNCDENGVMGVVPGIVGTLMCELAIRTILGQINEVNTLQLINLSNYTFRKLSY